MLEMQAVARSHSEVEGGASGVQMKEIESGATGTGSVGGRNLELKMPVMERLRCEVAEEDKFVQMNTTTPSVIVVTFSSGKSLLWSAWKIVAMKKSRSHCRKLCSEMMLTIKPRRETTNAELSRVDLQTPITTRCCRQRYKPTRRASSRVPSECYSRLIWLRLVKLQAPKARPLWLPATKPRLL